MRSTLMDSHYRSIQQALQSKAELDAKPGLKEFSHQQINALKDGDIILTYHDNNVFQLAYKWGQFELIKTKQLPGSASKWTSANTQVVKTYNDLDKFWKDFSADPKWYVNFKGLHGKERLSAKVLVLADRINSFFNALRRNHAFTYAEYSDINNWSNLVYSDQYKPTELKQYCSNCFAEVHYNPRYPKYICSECSSKTKLDKHGNRVSFSNIGFSGGLKIDYEDITGKTIREDDSRDYFECNIDGKLFFVREARFGGVVLQLKE